MRAPLLTILALSCPVAVAAAERQVHVDEVRIEGTRTVHPDRVRFVTAVRAGRSYADRDLALVLADDVRAIERMGPFTDTRSELLYGDDPTRVRVVLRVTELPYVASVAFAGIDDAGWGAEDELTKRMDTRAGGYANPLIIENDLRAVERYFRDQGHRGATARAESRAVPGGLALTIAVDLPPAVRIGRVIYRGLPAEMRRRRLDEVLDRVQLNRPGRPWQPEMLALDQEDVVRALQDEGWLDCALLGIEVERTDFVRPLDPRRRNGPEYVPDGAYNDRVHLLYSLAAGARYTLGTVSFVGNTVAPAEELARAFALESGAVYRRADIARAIERARRVISNQGYARCRVIQERRVDMPAHVVHLTLRFDEGRQYVVGRVDVRGNLMTRDAVLRRGLALNPGDRWNDDLKDESERQIQRTGLFANDPRRPLELRPEFPADRPDEADLVVDVVEDRSGSLQVQFGYSSATGVFGQFGYSERNFDLAGALSDPLGRWRGGGEILDLDLNVAQSRNSLSAGWTQPSLGDGPYSLGVTAARSESSQRAWDETRMGGSVSIGRGFLRNDLRLGLTWSYNDLRFADIEADAPDDAVAGSRFYNSLGLSATWDRLDNARLPTSGVVLSASDTLYGVVLPATDQVNEYQLKADGFVPLLQAEDGGVTFLRLAARWRQVEAVGETAEVPFYQRYLGGGPAPRHRGFNFNDLGPRVPNRNGFISRYGGDRDLLATAELSYPVQGYNEGVRTVLFADAGEVWAADAAVSPDDLRLAWGFGLRFPVQFPVSLDFAWLVDPRPGESTSQVHFGIGQIRF